MSLEWHLLVNSQGKSASELQKVAQAIRALPAEGDGMTVGDIANAVHTDTGMVVAALEEIAEQDEQNLS